ncbi:MAG: EutN/CcmL family microcompartment protein [Arenicellales bacterium]|jgi:microcompartment protein CcmK/EutM|nr:EutN/CcmL family microcompartment protein [Arenicellales bacterium]
MKIARVIGSVSGTIKDGRLVRQKLLLVNVVDASGAVLNSS